MTGNKVIDFLLILIAIVIAIIVLFKLIDILDAEAAAAMIGSHAWEVAG